MAISDRAKGGAENQAQTPEQIYARKSRPAFVKLLRLGNYLVSKIQFRLLQFRHRQILFNAKPLAEHLEENIFPLLHSEGERWLTISLRQNEEGEWSLSGNSDNREFQFPGTQELAESLQETGVRKIRLDHHLEFQQILEALLLLIHAHSSFDSVKASERQRNLLNSRMVASIMINGSGFHKSCMHMRYNRESKIYEVEYTYCELLFSRVIHNYISMKASLGDHRVLFQLTPRIAFLIFVVLILPIALAPSFPKLSLVIWIAADIVIALLAVMAMRMIGSIQYDKEHRDILIEEYIRRQRETEAELRRLNQELENLNELKDEFLRIASHDLKNPLTAILGSAGVVERLVKPGEPLQENVHRTIMQIGNRARDMQRIVEDFLDFQVLEGGQIRLESQKIDLGKLAAEVLESNEEYADRKGIAFELDTQDNLPEIDADRSRIQQVLQNLISNAIKFCNDGDHVKVSIYRDGQNLKCEVRDEGPGLTEKDLEKTFQKYARLSNKPTGGEKSSGLGLYICKQIVELHDGAIGATNNDDKGATFWFSLPLDSHHDEGEEQ